MSVSGTSNFAPRKFAGHCYVLAFLLCSSGCGALQFHEMERRKAMEIVRETREDYEVRYLGQPKEVLLKDFGKPTVRQNVFKNDVLYDEAWSYITSGSAWNTKPGGAVWFYIKDDRISKVWVW